MAMTRAERAFSRSVQRGLKSITTRWGGGGDFYRCVGKRSKGVSAEAARGICNKAHRAKTGIYPRTHARRLGGR